MDDTAVTAVGSGTEVSAAGAAAVAPTTHTTNSPPTVQASECHLRRHTTEHSIGTTQTMQSGHREGSIASRRDVDSRGAADLVAGGSTVVQACARSEGLRLVAAAVVAVGAADRGCLGEVRAANVAEGPEGAMPWRQMQRRLSDLLKASE
jgi:hypothetical protein